MAKLDRTVLHARQSKSKIAGIAAIYKAYPKHRLLQAKQFYEMITGVYAQVPAEEVSIGWCVDHWGFKVDCACSLAASAEPGWLKESRLDPAGFHKRLVKRLVEAVSCANGPR